MTSPPTTFPALLAARRDERPDRQALVTDAAALTYRQLDERSAAVAAGLVAAGVRAGDRVGLLAPNGIAWAVVAAAVMRTGAVLVPLSTIQRPAELQVQLQVAEASHLVVAPSIRGRAPLEEVASVRGEVPSLREVWSIDALPEGGDRAGVEALGEAVQPGDDLVVLFTSGSRGTPKGAVHTHAGALGATAAGLAVRGIGPDSVLYIPMPFFWTGGFSGGLVTALVAGATLITEAEPEPVRTLDLLTRERATVFRGWPDQAAALAAHPAFAAADLSELTDFSLGAVLPPERRPAPGARANLFGMTESFGPWCGDRLDRDLPTGKHGSCGRPFAGVEVRMADPDDGTEVAPGEQGEIWLRGPHLLRGYCGRSPEETFTTEGWFRTGDLGRRDGDGYVWFTGRVDDMVKVKGATVYPSEVEAALRALPEVRQAHVTDVADEHGRAEVAALVVSAAAAPDLRAQVRERLSAFKVPTRWVVVPDAGAVPLLASGKVDKVALQRLLAEQGTGAG